MPIIRLWKEKFAIAKAKKPAKGAFAVIDDKSEITVIIEQKKLKRQDAYAVERDYRLITFDMLLPFSLVGFIARIAGALANEKIPVFVVSGYSTDHVLIKEKYLKKAQKALESLGFSTRTG